MKIQITNHSTVVDNATASIWAAACALQLQQHAAPLWDRLPPVVEFCASGSPMDPSAYQMGIFDDSDQPGALGYHDYDEQGKPRGFVFAKTTIDNGGNASATLSHEMCEMFVDPTCTLWTQTGDGKMRALELCDAVEADEYTIRIGETDVPVSNFLLPAYFSAQPIGKTDYLDRLGGKPAPMRTPGGYDIVVDTTGNISQEFSRHFSQLQDWKARLKSHHRSRTTKRTLGRRP